MYIDLNNITFYNPSNLPKRPDPPKPLPPPIPSMHSLPFLPPPESLQHLLPQCPPAHVPQKAPQSPSLSSVATCPSVYTNNFYYCQVLQQFTDETVSTGLVTESLCNNHKPG